MMDLRQRNRLAFQMRGWLKFSQLMLMYAVPSPLFVPELGQVFLLRLTWCGHKNRLQAQNGQVHEA